MTTRAATCVLLLAAIAAIAPTTPAHAGAWSLARGEYYSELSGSVFSTTSFYDDNGTRIAPNLRLESRDFTSYNEFGWKKRVSAVLALSGRSVTAVAGFAPVELTQTGLTDLTFGLRGNLRNAAQGLAVEVDWTAPLGYDRELSGLLGDGRQRLAGSLAFGSALGTGGFAEASVGYLYRYEHFSADSVARPNYYGLHSSASFFTASADAGWWVTRSVLVGGRYVGQSVLSSSGGSENKDLETDAVRHLIGPFVRLRVDDRLDLELGSLSTAAGKNTPHLNAYRVALAFKQSRLNRLQGFLGGTHP